MKKKLGFALGAGGSRGVAHIGFLQAMEEAGIKPDFITGCSMGAVVGSVYAAGMPVQTMKEILCNLRMRDLLAPTGKRGGLFDTRKMHELFLKYLGDIEFSNLKTPFACTAVDMITQTLVEFSDGKVADAAVASATIPAIFRPITKGKMRLVDGGVLERVPFRLVKKMGADVVVCVDALGWRECKKRFPNTVGTLFETIDIMDNHRTKTQREAYRDLIDFWLEPELGNLSQYSLKKLDFMCEKGYELGKKYADEIKAALQ